MKEKIVEQLNKLLVLDRKFTETIVDTRHPVNENYALSKEFVCMDDNTAGLIGVLNGILEQDDVRIAASYEDDEGKKLIGFILVKRLVNYVL